MASRIELIHPHVRREKDHARKYVEQFWAEEAQALDWFQFWERVFEWNYPEPYRWFVGGVTNLCYNALDRQIMRGRAGHTALIYANERGERRLFTYAQLLHDVKRLAAALRGLGVKKGDRVVIYMPVCPEAIALMLACVRIGAIHMVVFAGFGEQALATRIDAAEASVLVTATVTYRKGKAVPLLPLVKGALNLCTHPVKHIVILNRQKQEIDFNDPRATSWEAFLEGGLEQETTLEPMEANDPAFIMATSGTTGRPKLVVHMHGGYAVWIMSTGRWVMDLKPEDVWWATSDIGWIVGHSYIVYAPLMTGCTTVAYEGALDYPTPEQFWSLIEAFHITGIFTAPTAVRLLMGYGADVARPFDLSSLERIVCAGEPLNAPAWEWLQQKVLQNHVPVIDHWWQTETGGPVIGNPYGIGLLPIKPGSASIPLPGVDIKVVDLNGNPCQPGEKGILTITRPFPGLTPTLWGEPERYRKDYWECIPGERLYFTGDAAMVDEDGYVWFAGRADEVLNIAGHRIGAIEIETALLQHPAVAEAGVTGRPDELRGEVASAFVRLKPGHTPSETLKKELIETVRRELGPVAVIGEVQFVSSLPKTRSGKIMRRVLKAVILDRDPGDISTIEEEGSLEEARRAWQALKAERDKEW